MTVDPTRATPVQYINHQGFFFFFLPFESLSGTSQPNVMSISCVSLGAVPYVSNTNLSRQLCIFLVGVWVLSSGRSHRVQLQRGGGYGHKWWWTGTGWAGRGWLDRGLVQVFEADALDVASIGRAVAAGAVVRAGAVPGGTEAPGGRAQTPHRGPGGLLLLHPGPGLQSHRAGPARPAQHRQTQTVSHSQSD